MVAFLGDAVLGELGPVAVDAPTVVNLGPPPLGTPIKDRYVGRSQGLTGPQGLPLLKPPFGRLTAIDLNTGEHVWVIPIGDGPRRHPLLESGQRKARIPLLRPAE